MELAKSIGMLKFKGGSYYLCLLLLCTYWLYAQPDKQSNIWYFGESAGLDFNAGIPLALTNGQIVAQFRNSSILCDNNGKLLLYSDGEAVWNKNHRVIAGATDIGGSSLTFNQNGVIIPHPKLSNQFYVFAIPYTTNGISDVLYSLIDLSLNAGEGGTIYTQKTLANSVARTMIVLRHCNGRDFWLLLHEVNTNNFRAYLIDENGISTTPVISSSGAVNYAKLGVINHSFFMRASWDSKKVATSQPNIGSNTPNFLEIFDFDNKTGKITAMTRGQDWIGGLNTGTILNDMVFSSDAKLLYFSRTFQASVPPDQVFTSHLFQLDLSKSTTDKTAFTLLASRTFILDPSRSDGPHVKGITGLQLATDGKLYVGFNLKPYLSVVNNPDVVGIGCQFVADAVYLDDRKMGWALPSLLPPKLPEIKVSITLKGNSSGCNDILESKVTGIDPNQVSYQWCLNKVVINNATQPELTLTQSGKYELMIEEINGCRNATSNEIDYTYKGNTTPAPTINKPATSICVGDKAPTFSASGTDIKWYEDKDLTKLLAASTSFTPTLNTAQSYTFYATQTDAKGCTSQPSLVNITVNELPVVSLAMRNILFCASTETLNLDPQSKETLSYQWYLNNTFIGTQNPLAVTNYGRYEVIATNAKGCIAKDYVDIKESCFQLYIPDIFTPNGDGINDQFLLMGMGINDFDLLIYNRWGELIKVFQQQSFNNMIAVWDGTIQGKEAPTGIYTYLMTVRRATTDPLPEIIKRGEILLMR